MSSAVIIVIILARSKKPKKKKKAQEEKKAKPTESAFQPDQIPIAATRQSKNAPVKTNAYSNTLAPAKAPVAARNGISKSYSTNNIAAAGPVASRDSPPNAIQERNPSYVERGRSGIISPGAIQMTSSQDEPMRKAGYGSVVPTAGGRMRTAASQPNIAATERAYVTGSTQQSQAQNRGSLSSYQANDMIAPRNGRPTFSEPVQPMTAGSIQPTQSYRGVNNQRQPG